MRARYLYDSDALAQDSAAGRPHWPAYTPLMLETLGLAVSPIEPAALVEEPWEEETAVLFLTGPMDGDMTRLRQWIEGGGILVAWGAPDGMGRKPWSPALEALLGVRAGEILPQADEFAVGAQIALRRHPLTAGVASPLAPGRPLLAFSGAQVLVPEAAEPVADLLRADGTPAGGAALTARRGGAGWAFGFAFDLAKTVRVLHHGRPVDRDHDGDGMLRVSDAIVTRGFDLRVPYSDALLFLLRNLLARRPLPLIAPLPPVGGVPAEALFFYGGDDECDPGMAVAASRRMRERGLPYHANLMPRNGRFAVTPAEAEEMKAAGHEISLHLNFIDGFDPGGPFTEADVREQVRLFERTYGRLPVCTVNHCCRWCGWIEPARWLGAAGVRADNSRVHRGSPPLNPVNELAFGFGTAFPFWFCDDASGGDRRLPVLCQPITAYEIGYRSAISGSAPTDDPDQKDLARVAEVVEIALHYHLTVNMFYHPVYIARSPACRAAIDELLRLLRERGAAAAHMGNDALYDWWEARSRSLVAEWQADAAGLRFVTRCAASGGMVVQIPLGEATRAIVEVDGTAVASQTREEFGQQWLWAMAPEGEHEVQVSWETG
jgi:hypothetical protein